MELSEWSYVIHSINIYTFHIYLCIFVMEKVDVIIWLQKTVNRLCKGYSEISKLYNCYKCHLQIVQKRQVQFEF